MNFTPPLTEDEQAALESLTEAYDPKLSTDEYCAVVMRGIIGEEVSRKAIEARTQLIPLADAFLALTPEKQAEVVKIIQS